MTESKENANKVWTRWLEWVDGYKAFITAGAILAAGILGEFALEVPDYVWAALAAVGLASLRHAVKKAEPGT
jgi:hypothetical protein